MMIWSGKAGVTLGICVDDGVGRIVGVLVFTAKVYMMVGGDSGSNVGVPVTVGVIVAVNVLVGDGVRTWVAGTAVGKGVRVVVGET